MTDPTPTITCFVQTNMVGMSSGEIVTLARTPYVDALIAGGRLVAADDPIFTALLAEYAVQPAAWDLLATAHSAASPVEPVTPASVALDYDPTQVPVEAPAEVAPVAAPVDPAPVAPAPVDPAPVAPAPVDPAPVAPAPVDPAV